MYRKILAPLDGSPLAEVALPHAISLAQQFDAELLLLRIFGLPPQLYSALELASTAEAEVLASRSEAESYLQTAAFRLRKEGLRVTTLVDSGPIAETIVDLAQVEGVDVIVMSTHGRSGLGRWVYGSVADRVLRSAHVPILLIRAQQS